MQKELYNAKRALCVPKKPWNTSQEPKERKYELHAEAKPYSSDPKPQTLQTNRCRCIIGLLWGGSVVGRLAGYSRRCKRPLKHLQKRMRTILQNFNPPRVRACVGSNDQPEGPLDPLVRGLLSYTNQDDLMRRISDLYQRLDLDESGAIGQHQVSCVAVSKTHSGVKVTF